MRRPGQARPRRERPPDGRAAQTGSVLLAVMAVGAAVMAVGAVTLLQLRHGLRQAGQARENLQSLHAAEAGVAFLSSRLNGMTLCNPWFTYQDSLNVVALLRDTLVKIPSRYGEEGHERAFRIRDIEVVEKARPIRVRYVSEGGILVPGTDSLDAGSSRAVVASLRMKTLADFARFVEGGGINYGAGANIQGKVHSGGSIGLNGDRITFNKKVTYATNLVYGSGVDPSTVVFKKGHERNGSNPMTLDHIHIHTGESRPVCGGVLARTYQELASGSVPHEGRGFAYPSGAGTVLLVLDSVKVEGGRVRFPWYAPSGTSADRPGTLLRLDSLPLEQFNGVVYAGADISIRGTLRNLSLTVASLDDIVAMGDVICEGNEVSGDNRVTLGLIAQDNFLIWENSPTRTRVEAVIVAEDDHYASKGGYNGSYSNWEALGTTSSHPGVDAEGHAAGNGPAANWVLHMVGGIITEGGGSSGPWGSKTTSTHDSRIYDFDNDMFYSPPPKFLLVRARNSGIPLWEVDGWDEIHRSRLEHASAGMGSGDAPGGGG